MPNSRDDKILRLAQFGALTVTVIGWLRVFISPTIIFTVLGGLTFLYFGQGRLGAVLWGVFAAIGMLIGAVWAERVRKGVGLVEFHSRLIATPGLDKPRADSREEK